MLYGLVFVTRYLDIFSGQSWDFAYAGTFYMICFKLFYLTSSLYVVFIMMKVFPRTRERERAWKLGIYSVIGSLVLAPLTILIFERHFAGNWFLEVRHYSLSLSHAPFCKLLISNNE